MNKGELWWCDLSPTVGNEAAGLKLCEILEVLEGDLVCVMPYFRISNKICQPMKQHRRTISTKRLKEKWNKDEVVICNVKEKE